MKVPQQAKDEQPGKMLKSEGKIRSAFEIIEVGTVEKRLATGLKTSIPRHRGLKTSNPQNKNAQCKRG